MKCCIKIGLEKLEFLATVDKRCHEPMFSCVEMVRSVSDRRTDRQTDGAPAANTRYMLSRVKIC